MERTAAASPPIKVNKPLFGPANVSRASSTGAVSICSMGPFLKRNTNDWPVSVQVTFTLKSLSASAVLSNAMPR